MSTSRGEKLLLEIGREYNEYIYKRSNIIMSVYTTHNPRSNSFPCTYNLVQVYTTPKFIKAYTLHTFNSSKISSLLSSTSSHIRLRTFPFPFPFPIPLSRCIESAASPPTGIRDAGERMTLEPEAERGNFAADVIVAGNGAWGLFVWELVTLLLRAAASFARRVNSVNVIPLLSVLVVGLSGSLAARQRIVRSVSLFVYRGLLKST